MKNKIINFLFITLMISNTKCLSQKINNNHEMSISELSWSSFDVIYKYGIELKIDENSISLVEFGKRTSPNLVEALKDSNKTVIAHLILTKIWEPEVYFLRIEEEILDEIKITKYLVNNLEWYDSGESKVLAIDKFEQERIYNYWKNRISIP